MAKQITEVRPGDLITAESWNSLLTKLAELETLVQQLSVPVVTGKVDVPDLFGRSLSEAKGMLGVPSRQLTVGFVLDVFGKLVDTGLQASGKLLVLNQTPAPGEKANPGSSVNLLAASAGSGTSTPTPPPEPKIKNFIPNPAIVGLEVIIEGSNFAPSAKDNTVIFGGKEASTPLESTVNTLRVIVPTKIKDAPTSAGQPPLKDVEVLVKLTNGQTAKGSCDIGPPPAEPVPQITKITPNPGKLNQNLIIEGTNFSTKPEDNVVLFTDFPQGGVVATLDDLKRLVVKVPKDLPGFNMPPPQTIGFKITVATKEGLEKNIKSPSFNHDIAKLA